MKDKQLRVITKLCWEILILLATKHIQVRDKRRDYLFEIEEEIKQIMKE